MSFETSLTPDQALDAQMSILGSMLIDSRCVGQVVTKMTDTQFSGEYRTIFQTIKTMYQNGDVVDPVTVNNAMGSGYGETLMQLMEVTPTAANVSEYIKIAIEKATLDDYHQLGLALTKCQTTEEAQEVMERLNKITQRNTNVEIVSAYEGYLQALERIDQPPDYFNWHFQKLSDIIMAKPGNYVCVAARPSVGKTALTLQIAWDQSQQFRVGYFSFETSTEEIYDRLLALSASVDSLRLQRKQLEKQEIDRIISVNQSFAGRNLDIIDASGLTVTNVRNITMENRYDIIYIDYLQIVTPERWINQGNRTDVVSQISLGLKSIARQLKVLVVANSQLRRSQNKTDFDPPTLSDLRESGQIEQDVDAAMLLYKRKSDWKTPPRDMFIAKNRKGPAGGLITFTFDGPTQEFREIDGEKLEECTPSCITHGDKVSPTGLTGKQNLPF